MTVKSVIDIEINDTKFKEFTALFGKYQSALKEMPAGWSAVNTEIAGAGTIFEAVLAGMLTQHQLSEKVEKKARGTADATKKTAGYWKDMATSTKTVAGNITRATESLLKWIGLTSVFSGLLGAGGLYGIDRMAAGVAAGRRSSQGVGTTYGSEKAFGINFGQLVDPGAFLGSVNQALHSWSDKAGLFGAGMTQSEMKGDTAQVGVALLDHLKRIADNTNPAGLSDVMRARHLDQFVSVEDMMRLKTMTPSEFKKYKSGYASDSRDLNLTHNTQDAWLSFTQQMHRAGQKIENVFVNGLVKLEPTLEKLSNSFVNMVEKIGHSGVVDRALDAMAAGLNKFGDFIDGPDFDKTLQALLKSFDALGDAAAWAASKFAVSPEYKREHFPTPALSTPTRHPRNIVGGDDLTPDLLDKFSQIEESNGFRTGLFKALAYTESSFNKNAIGPDIVLPNGQHTRALGMFQFLPKTADEVGVKNVFDPTESAEGMGRRLKRLARLYEGDMDKVLAANNWGEGNLNQDISQYGDKWGAHLPDATVDYVNKINRLTGKPPTMNDESRAQARGAIAQNDIRALVNILGRQSSVTRIDIANKTGNDISAVTSAVAPAAPG